MLDNSVTRLEVRSGARSVIPAQQYQAYDSVTVVDAAESLGDQPYVAVRQGNDLVLLYADGTEVVLQDYFLGDTLFSMDGLGGVIELPADMAPIGTVDGKALYAFGGSPDAAGSILAKSSSFSPLEPLLADETLGAALLGEGSVGLALGGLGAGGLGLAAMGGGGGAAAFFGSVSNALTVISGTFVAGPVIAGNGLVVDIYDAQGQLIQAGIPLNEDGSFSVTLQGTVPNVIAIMRDLNENPDYRDEATGADTDLDATLMGLGAGDPQPNGTTNVSLNINPVTTVAARLAGVSSDGTIPAGGVSPEKITESIQKVQDSFGLPDINGVAPKDIFDEDFNDTDGDIDDGERYGQVLAMLSGKDKLNGDQGATIEEFVSAIEGAGDDTAGAQSAVRSELLAGAREFEFNNESGTQTEADLLRAPSLGVERTPEVGEDGETTEPSFSALLEDSLEGTSTGTGTNANADTIEGFQTLVDTADAVQALAVLDPGAEIPQEVLDQLTEENLTALGLTGLAAPSPYLEEFLEALRDAEAGGADTVAELQALLDAVIEDILTPSQDVTANDDGTLSVSGTGEPGSTVAAVFPDGTTGTALVAGDGSYGPITSEAPQTSGDVSVTATDEAGNTSDPLTEAYSDSTAPLAPSQDVTPNDDGTLSVSGTGEPGSTVTAVFPDGTTGTALVGEDGSYGPITSEAPQSTGAVSTRQSDEAGNTSPLTTEAYTDTTAPLAPSIDPVTANDDGTLSVSGTGEPGSTATVRFPDGTIGAAVVGPDGTFGPITSSSPQTTGDVTATQTDGAGNVSPAETVAYSDTAGPQAPVLGDIEQNLDGTLSVSGTGEPGAIASVTFPDGSIGTTTVRPDGSFGPVTSDAPQTDGTVSALQTDEAGNPSESDTATFDDGQAPLAPANLVAAPNEDGTIDVSGTGEPGSTATVTFPDGTTTTVLVGDDGTFGPVTSAAPQTTGEVSVTQTDEAGNTSAPAATEAYFDETPPLPVNLIVTPNDDGTIDVSGTGEPGSTATVFFPDGTTATALIGDDGAFGPVTSAAPQTTGAVTATQTDEANNVSEPSTEDYVDTTEPLDPTVDPITPNDDGTLSVSGTGEPGATMTVFFPDGTSATATVESDGTFGPVTSEAPQTSGDVIVNQADEAGNQSEDVVSAYTDETAPLEPVLDAPTQNEDGTLSVSGTGEPGSTVEVTFPDGTVGTALVDDGGNFGPVTSAAPQTTGDISATQTDEAGNTSEPVTEAYADSTAPLAPSQDVTTNDDGTLSVSGTGEPGSTVTTTFPDGTTGTALVAADGSYGPITSEAPQTTGDVSSTQEDAAGNTSEPQSETVTDETAPLAPSQDVTTNDDGTLSVSGAGEPGSTVTTTFPDGRTGTALVAEDGNYGPITSEGPQLSTDVETTQTDEANNTSQPAVDETAPLAPLVDSANADGLSGTAEPGSTVTLFDDNEPPVAIATATVGEDGTWSIPAEDFPEGTEGFAGSVTATDEAGNESAPAPIAAIDGTAPTIEITTPIEGDDVVNAVEDVDVLVAGTTDAETGQTVTVTFTDSASATVTAEATVSEGGWSLSGSEADISGLEEGEITVTANVSDSAGNAATEASATVTLDNSAPTIEITTPIEGDDLVNAVEDVDVLVAGTTDAETGQTVTVTFTDSASATVTAEATVTEGGWSLTGSEADISGLEEGEITVTANVSDAAGNAATEASATVTLDNSAPTIEITPGIAGDDVVNASEDEDVFVAGTTDAENGQIVTVTFTDSADATVTATATVTEGGWSLNGSGTDISALANGEITVTANVSDAAGNAAPEASATATLDNTVEIPTINPGITDQGNTVSGTGEPGATVSVSIMSGGVSEPVGSAVVWTDGTWSFVADTPIADGATLHAVQRDAAGNFSLEASQVTFTDTDGDGTSNEDSADDDGDGISDTDEAATESESVITYPAQTVASNMSIGSPTPGYSSGTTTDASSGSLIDITAVAPGESGNGTTITELGTGTISRFNYKANVVGGETVEDLTIGIAIGSFDDGLYVEIDGTVIVDFTGRDYQSLPSMLDYNSDGNADDFGFAWAPFRGEGDPELVVDLVNQTVQLLVTETDGVTRSDIFAAMLADEFDATPNAVPIVDATSANGVTIGTGFRNANINSGDGGNISDQTITVTGRFAGADDVDGDVVAGTSVLIENWVDIDSDNDRVWDKYDGIADSDGDGVSDYRDPDSDDDGTPDGVQASLNQAQINALIAGGTHADQFIVLSDAVTMDFTAISATAFSNVEYLDMNDGANAQTVTIDAAALTAMTDADNELIIVGGSNDTVNAIGFVDTGKDQSIQGQRFNIYESNDATLIIRDGVNVSLTEEGAVPELTTPTLDASITDQANTVSGTGDAGATVTVSDGDIVIGTAVVWTDGLWSFVADSPIADGAELTVTQSLDGFTSAASTVTTFTDTDGDGTANSALSDSDGDAIADTAEDEGFRNTTGTGTNDLRFVQWGTDFDNGVQVGDTQTLVLPDGSVVTFTVTGVTSSLPNGTDDNIAGAPSTFSGAFLNTRYTSPDGSINGPVNGTDTFTFAISAVDVLGNTINPTVFWADSEATADVSETNGATTNGGNWTVVEQDGSPGVNGVGTQTVTVTNSNGTGGAIYSSTNATEVIVTIQGNGGVQGFSLGVVADPDFDYQDLDQDGIDNSLDIDTDGDRLWDKYETGSDGNGVPNYRDTDSDNNGTEDGVEESVTAGEIEALTTGSDTYGEGYILLSEAVTLDFTQIDDARFTADVEYIDMNDGIRQVVTLNESEVIALTDADNELIIVGDSNDVVNATGFVDTGQDQSIQGQTFSIYEANGAALFIDDEITNIVTT